MGFEDTLICIQSYHDRLTAQWQQTRLIVYTIAMTVTEPDKRVEIYDLIPLPGDPTPEERMAAVKKQHDAILKEQADFTEMVRSELMREKKKT